MIALLTLGTVKIFMCTQDTLALKILWCHTRTTHSTVHSGVARRAKICSHDNPDVGPTYLSDPNIRAFWLNRTQCTIKTTQGKAVSINPSDTLDMNFGSKSRYL